MTRCDTCEKNLDQMEVQSVTTDNGDFCLICAAREIDRLHKLEESIRWRKWPEEKPEKSGRYLKLLRDRCEELTRFNLDEYCKVTQKWWGGDPIYWRPIGNLPEGGE